MKLHRVKYNLFSFEIDSYLFDDHHLIDGEVVLEFIDAPKIYISWKKEQEGYSVGIQNNSFFASSDMVLEDISNNTLWKSLVNQNIAFEYSVQNQVLALKSNSSKSIYISSFENGRFLSDSLTISEFIPEQFLLLFKTKKKNIL